jgi:hypothetical protein
MHASGKFGSLRSKALLIILSLLGTKYSGIRFRRALLDTVPGIGQYPAFQRFRFCPVSYPLSLDADTLAHIIIPTHPKSKPHARMLHHFRFIIPLLPMDEDGLTPLHYYDSAIHLARISSNELSESEFETGMKASSDILKWYVRPRQELS